MAKDARATQATTSMEGAATATAPLGVGRSRAGAVRELPDL